MEDGAAITTKRMTAGQMMMQIGMKTSALGVKTAMFTKAKMTGITVVTAETILEVNHAAIAERILLVGTKVHHKKMITGRTMSRRKKTRSGKMKLFFEWAGRMGVSQALYEFAIFPTHI